MKIKQYDLIKFQYKTYLIIFNLCYFLIFILIYYAELDIFIKYL
jgi:hypothetical protein